MRDAGPEGSPPGTAGRGADRRPGRRWRNRLLLAVGAVGTMGVLVTATSFALFTSQSSAQTDSFAAGTVILTSGSSNCTFSNLEAGDSRSCTYQVTYTGSLDAWITLGVTSTSTAEAAYYPVAGTATLEGGQSLLNAVPGNHGLQVTISDNQGTGTAPEAFPLGKMTCANVGTPGTSLGQKGYQDQCTTTATPEVVVGQGKDATTGCMNTNSCVTVGGDGSVSRGWTDTFTVTGTLPLSAGNKYQGSTATISLVANAQQASNNSDVQPSKILIASNNTWSGAQVLASGVIPQGNAVEVCLNPNTPYPCPPGAVDFNYTYAQGNWAAPLSNIPGARWIWANVTPTTPTSTDRTVQLSKEVYVPAPVVSGNVYLYTAADNYSTVWVNGTQVGTVGSATGEGVSSAYNGITTVQIPGTDFKTGVNTIMVQATNLPDGGGNYNGNPAGIVLGGTLYLQ